MNWLHPDEARSRMASIRVQAQCLMFPATMSRLHESLPAGIQPEADKTDPLHRRLYFDHDGRFFVIDFNTVIAHPDGPIYMTTPFITDKTRPDWDILRELPQAIDGLLLNRPAFIQSRAAAPQFTVYRKHLNGWNCRLYDAANRNEAGALEGYLRQLNGGLESYVIDKHEEPGHWQVEIISDTRRSAVAGYSHKETSLSYAYGRSSADLAMTLCVWNTQGQGRDPWYVVRNQKIEENGKLSS